VQIPDLEGEEGIVVLFENGHCIKVKTAWYVRIHKAKDGLNIEKNVVEMIVSDKCDDVIPFLTEPEKIRLESFRDVVVSGIAISVMQLTKMADKIQKTNMTRKDFALNEKMEQSLKSIIFNNWDNLSAIDNEAVTEHILNHIGKQKHVDQTRHIWGYHKWNAHETLK
jgi:RNA ligase